jgi:hypothetical protein
MMPGDFITSDLAAFFTTTDFATAAILWDGTGINVIFDNSFVDAQGVEVLQPVIHAKSADVTALVHGDPLVIEGTVYYIRGIQPDGTGVTRLVMSKE